MCAPVSLTQPFGVGRRAGQMCTLSIEYILSVTEFEGF